MNVLFVFNIHQGNSSYASFCTADNIQISNMKEELPLALCPKGIQQFARQGGTMKGWVVAQTAKHLAGW
jgi:hypothetical protein